MPNRRSPQYPPAHCLSCNAVFKPTGSRQLHYCSDPCWIEHNHVKQSAMSHNGTQCWEWTGRKTNKGYGTRAASTSQGERECSAYRVSYAVAKGSIPAGMLVRHLCNNPSCVNPDHLEVGTHLDNMRDKVKAGRQSRAKGHAKLDAAAAREIFLSTDSAYVLAARYGVCHHTVRKIRKRECWADITAGLSAPNITSRSRKLTAQDAVAIYASTKSVADLASDYSITEESVIAIQTGKTWSRVTGHIHS